MPRSPRLLQTLHFIRPIRTPIRNWRIYRFMRGGRLSDAGRLPRYVGIFSIACIGIWGPILTYLREAPLSFRSDMSLILPGSGASASVNLDSIGQASSYANSAFSSNSISPTETYKRLLSAERIVERAAEQVGMAARDFGQPRIELVDQTSLIHISLTAPTPEGAHDRLDALRAAFFQEIEKLRSDEIVTRETGASTAIAEYRESVLRSREDITRLQQDTGLLSADQYHTLVDEADALQSRVQDLRATLDESAGAVAALENVLGLSPRLASMALRLHADTEFAALSEEMSLRAAELAEARGKFGARHPAVRTAEERHASARAAARARATFLTGITGSELDRLDISHVGSRTGLLSDLVSQETARAGLAAEYEALANRLAEDRLRLDTLLGPVARLEDLQRDLTVAEAVFASAMARIQSSKTDLFASYPLVQVLEDPSVPLEPSSPKRKLALAAGVAATLFFVMGLMLGWLRRPLIDRIVSGPDRKPEDMPDALPAE